MLVDVAEHGVVFEEGRHAAGRGPDLIAGIDRVAENAGVAEQWPVAMAEAFGMVKVGNSEWVLWKLTPWSRSAAMAGAVSGVTVIARRPSGTKRTTLWGGSAA